MTHSAESEHSAPLTNVLLWRCPNCGAVAPMTGQSARYCGATIACTEQLSRGRTALTPMERWVYAPHHKAPRQDGQPS